MPAPEFTRRDADVPAKGLILMLHGGRADSHAPVDDSSASWRRAAWMQREICDRAHAAGVSIWLLRYLHRGWNESAGPVPSPVPDARWALDEVRRDLGEVPVVLLGHSMGARTAVAVADDPSVSGVVALAPWLPCDEPVRNLTGKRFAAAQGRKDRITSYQQTRTFTERTNGVASTTEFQDMGRVGHYMFRGRGRWNEFAITRALAFG